MSGRRSTRRVGHRALLFATGAVLATAPLALGAQDDAARPISLREAVDLAQRNAPATVQARGVERTVSAQRRAAYGSFLPNMNFSLGTNRTQGVQFFQGQFIPLRGDPWNYSNGLGANLELFDGGRRFNELSRTKAAAEAAEAGVVSARFDVALQVKQQFYAALAARESEAAARAQLEQAEQQLKASVARLSAGVATLSDSLRSVIQVGNAQLAVLTAENDLRVANAALTRLVGAATSVTAAPEDTATLPPPLPEEEVLERYVANGPAVLAAEANLAAARASRKAQRTQYLPTLTMSWNYSTNQSSPGFATDRLFLLGGENPNRQTMNFNFSYPLFNGFSREQQTVQASVAQDNADAQLRDARLAARQSFVQLMRAEANAVARVQVQQQAIAAAEEDLRVQQQRYALGASTLLDLLTSQTQLNQARQALIQARFDARVARAQLESLIGRTL